MQALHLFDLTQALLAVHAGHIEVQKDVVGVLPVRLPKQGQCFGGVITANAVDGGVYFLHGFHKEVHVVLIIINDQNGNIVFQAGRQIFQFILINLQII